MTRARPPLERHRGVVLLLLPLAALGAAWFALSVGSAGVRFGDSLAILWANATGGAWGSALDRAVVLDIRLPRVLLAFIVGMSLATAGVTFQAVFRNPLADPFLLGVAGGGALGAALAMGLGLGFRALGLGAPQILGFAGSLLTIGVVYRLARIGGRLPTQTLLLAGVIVSFFLSAMIMLLVSVYPERYIEGVMFWMMGNLSALNVDRHALYVIAGYAVLGCGVLFVFARRMNLFLLGEEAAGHLGMNVGRTKRQLFVLASVVTGLVVSVSGVIGFVGLIIPHLARLAIGADHRTLVPAAAMLGGIFLLAADTIARTVFLPTEIPVGAVTAMAGAPFFLYLLRSGRRGESVP
ncbi:MAG: FecCD family ABC transporter permease [Myxococcota bacterium]